MKIFFGDNQFLGVNHSGGKSQDYLKKYSTPEEIAETLKDAWSVGIKDFCFTVDKKTIEAICLIHNECPFNLHPALPYAHGVNDLIAEKGLAAGLYFKIKGEGFFNVLIASLKALFGNYDHIFKILISSELKGLPMENIKSIGLLNIATDFLIGLKRDDLLFSFYRAVKKGFSKKPLFYTLNFPKLAGILWESNLNDSAIVFNYNSSSFRTNPSLQEINKKIKKYNKHETIAMSIFSGGDAESIKSFLSNAPDLSGVLFGTSKKENMSNNFKLFSSIN